MTAFVVSTLTPHLGAQVEGLDLSQPLDAPRLHDLHQAFADWGVLVFRNQHLDREAHKAFGRYFGDLHVHPMNYSRKSDPEILIVKTTKDSPYTAGDAWHTDVTCDAIPPLASALYITETPEVGGGDTLFADMYLAYELYCHRPCSSSSRASPPSTTAACLMSAPTDQRLQRVGIHEVNIRSSRCTQSPARRCSTSIAASHPTSKGLRRWESQALLDALFAHIAATTSRLLLPGAVGTQHPHPVGQPLHPTPRRLGLSTTQPLWRAGVGARHRTTRRDPETQRPCDC